jgi:hypothetical protein
MPRFPSPGQKVPRVGALKEMLQISQEFDANHDDGIATGKECWFRYFYLWSKMFA